MRLWIGAMALSLGAGALVAAQDKPTTKPAYPLDVCVVSGDKLGGMGDPVIFDYNGREVRFCCPMCVDEFKKDPAKFIKKLDEAAAKPATQPAKS